MLTSLYQAILQHLSALDAPVFQAGCVPAGQRFPYATLEIAAPLSPDGTGTLTLTAWCCGNAAHQERLALADALLALIPVRGLRLFLEEGSALLLMNDARAQCIQSGEAQGIRLVWELHFFPAA